VYTNLLDSSICKEIATSKRKGAMVAGPPWTLPTVFSRLNGALRMACASRKPTWLEKGAQTENHSESLFPVIESPMRPSLLSLKTFFNSHLWAMTVLSFPGRD